MSALRCIVVDDEPLACDLIAGYVRQPPFLELVGCYTNALSVIDALHSDANIDLLFLDIQMPQLSGMESVSYTHLDVYKRQSGRLTAMALTPFSIRNCAVPEVA